MAAGVGDQARTTSIARRVRTMVRAASQASPRLSWVLGNHDRRRAASPYGGGRLGARRQLALHVLTSFLPGTMWLYQGEELALEDGAVPSATTADPLGIAEPAQSRDGARTSMPWQPGPALGFTTATPWLPACGRTAADTVAVQAHDRASPLRTMRRLLTVRRLLLTQPNPTAPVWTSLDKGGVVAYRRGFVIVTVNLGDTTTPAPPLDGTAVFDTDDPSSGPSLRPPGSGPNRRWCSRPVPPPPGPTLPTRRTGGAVTRSRATLTLYAALGCLGYLLNGLGAVLPQLRGELALSRAEAALYPSGFALGLLTVGGVGDRLAQHLGRWALPATLAVLGSGALLLAAANRAVSGAGALLLGLGGAGLVQLVPAGLRVEHGQRAAVAIGEANAVSSSASALAPLLVGAAIAAGVGWRAGYLVVPLAAIAAVGTAALRTAPADGAPSDPIEHRDGEERGAGRRTLRARLRSGHRHRSPAAGRPRRPGRPAAGVAPGPGAARRDRGPINRPGSHGPGRHHHHHHSRCGRAQRAVEVATVA